MSQELIALKQRILDHLVKYMKFGSAKGENDPGYNPNFDAGYTQTNVDQCEEILDAFLVDLANVSGAIRQEQIRTAVKTIVLGLNKVNEDCDRPLIETLEREYFCDFIITAARQAGLASDADDITEEWREW